MVLRWPRTLETSGRQGNRHHAFSAQAQGAAVDHCRYEQSALILESMRHFARLIAFTALLAACRAPAPAAQPETTTFDLATFEKTYFWDLASAEWASSPTLVIAEKDSLYPRVPDVQIAIVCRKDGALDVWGDAYGFATDVGGPASLMPVFGLRSPGVSMMAEPIWEHGGFSKHASYVLHPTRGQRDRLLQGEWFEVAAVYADGSGTVRYPPPPSEMAKNFAARCDALSAAG